MVHWSRQDTVAAVVIGLAITAVGVPLLVDWRRCATRVTKVTLRRWLVTRWRGLFPSIGAMRLFGGMWSALGGGLMIGAVGQLNDAAGNVAAPVMLSLMAISFACGVAMIVASVRADRRFRSDPSLADHLISD